MKLFGLRAIKLDILIAAVVLIASGSASGFVYKKMAEERQREVLKIEGIHLGEKRYGILSNDVCIGYIRTNFTSDREVSELKLDGAMRLAVAGMDLMPSVEGTLQFNNLGQLCTSYFKLRAPGIELSFGTSGLRTMRTVLRVTMNEQPKTIETQMTAGPFVIATQKDGTYSLAGPLPENMLGMGQQPVLQATSEKLDVTVVEDAQSEPRCSGGTLAPIDLTAVIPNLQSLVTK